MKCDTAPQTRILVQELFRFVGTARKDHDRVLAVILRFLHDRIDASAIDNAECDDRSKQHCHRRLDTAVRGDCSLLYRDNCCALQRLAETRKAAQISVYAQFLRMTPYWYGSTIILKDGFVYFVDEEEMSVDQITEGYCYFKARHMKYRIIPD